MKKIKIIPMIILILMCIPVTNFNATVMVESEVTHEGHFNVEVGDQYEFVWASVKDSEGNPVTDGSWSYPDAPGSEISQGDHFYIDVDKINMSVGMGGTMSPAIFGNFTFADGSKVEQVQLMGYFKAMNSTEYNWTYWQTYYENKGYDVEQTAEYFQYITNTTPAMRMRWDVNDGAMLEWELSGYWIQMMGFGTLSELIITRYDDSGADYGVEVGDHIPLQWATLLDSEGNPVTDGSYSYPDAPDSAISQGDNFTIEITTINTSMMMGTVVYGKFHFESASSPEVMLMGYVKTLEWAHHRLYYTYKGYTVYNNDTHLGYMSGSPMGGPLLKMLWDKPNGVVNEFWMKGYWIQMMGFGTLSEVKLVKYEAPTPETSTSSSTSSSSEDSSEPTGSPGFMLPILLTGMVAVAAYNLRKRRK